MTWIQKFHGDVNTSVFGVPALMKFHDAINDRFRRFFKCDLSASVELSTSLLCNVFRSQRGSATKHKYGCSLIFTLKGMETGRFHTGRIPVCS